MQAWCKRLAEVLTMVQGLNPPGWLGSWRFRRTRSPAAMLEYSETRCRVKIPRDALKLGGIVGEVGLVDCVERHRSKWFRGPFGFALANARVLPVRPMPGMSKFFHAEC